MSPGQNIPRLFKRIRLVVEIVDVAQYKRQLGFRKDPIRGKFAFRLAVVRDLERRRDLYCPGVERIDPQLPKAHAG